MKIFLDTANVEAIKKLAATGLINGVTTNPTHLSKEGGDPTEKVLEICSLLKNGEVSVEVTQKEPQKVYEQAHAIAQLAKNVVVKVPCHASYYPVIHKLVQDGIPLNITLVFTLIQSAMMCKLGVRYISPFVGRLDDIDVDGSALLYELRYMVDSYAFETQILAASIRHEQHVHQAIMAGVDVITMAPTLFEQITMHPLTDSGMEKFDADWQKLGIKQFP